MYILERRCIYSRVICFNLELNKHGKIVLFILVRIPVGEYWKWWECTGHRFGTGSSGHLLTYVEIDICIIIPGFDFIFIKSKLYFRPKGLYKISNCYEEAVLHPSVA